MDTYRTDDVAQRIADVFGDRPTANQIHKAILGPQRTPRALPPVTAGLPAPIRRDDQPERSALEWDSTQIEHWLLEHPRLRTQQLLSELDRRCADLAATGRRAGEIALIRWAREHDLSWAQIADALSRARQEPISRQAVAQRFARLS